MKFFKKQRPGFTLIELLIVVAIIGILSAVVLASLNSARGKAKESKVKSELSSMRAQAELFYNSNGYSYAPGGSGVGSSSGSCDDGMFNAPAASNGLDALVESIKKETGATAQCYSEPNTWSASATIGTTTWCVDSNGSSKEGTASATGCM